MQEIKDALLRMVTATRKVKRMQEAYHEVGLNDNILFDAYGDICDAIYHLIGERTEVYEGSATDVVMKAMNYISDERMATMLMAEYRKNHPEQPKPNVCTTAELFKMFNENGGYMTPEGDWT